MGANENTAADPAAQRTPLHKTTALCPDCLDELPAEVYADAEGVVWMERTCPDHGRLATRMWPDAEHYQWLRSLAFPMTAPQNTLAATAPCPHGCGTCSRHQRRGTLLEIDGVLSDLSGLAVEGYEIHMGETVRDASAKPLVRLLRREGEIEDGCQTENAFGTYLHGVFDAPEAALRTAQALAKKKGVTLTDEALDTHAYKEQQYDKLADSVRKSLDMERIYRIMEGKA